jgi:hypothetical protein
MSWDGYFTLDRQEFINVARTEAYAAGQPWFRAVFNNADLPLMLGDVPYTTPLLDNAPWTDPDVPESYDFFGLYPLGVTGIEDSSRGSTVVEYTTEGGSPGSVRHGTKSIVFNALLLGASEKAVAYGRTWLNRVLLGDRCNNPLLDHDHGTTLEFVSSDPRMSGDPNESPEGTLAPLMRAIRRVSINQGPTVMSQRVVESCGGAVWNVQFTAVAGTPWLFGPERPLLSGYLDPLTADPWAPGVVGGTVETTATPYVEVPCGDDTWEPIYDPMCAALITPPAPPSVPLGCLDLPAETETTITNHAINPSVETNSTHWTSDAQWTGARTAAADAAKGAYEYRATVATLPTVVTNWMIQWHTTTKIAATPGQLVGIRVRLRTKPGTVRTVELRLRSWAGGVAGPNTGFATNTVTVTEEWDEFTVSGILPAGADSFGGYAGPATPGQWAATNWISGDGLQVWKDVDPGPDSYFDGDTPDEFESNYETVYTWTGTAHASTTEAVTVTQGWERRKVVLPAASVPVWDSLAPVVALYAPEEARNVRLRFYRDPEGDLDPTASPCAFDSDLLISYIPAEGTLIIDSASEEVWVETVSGQRRRADTLVFTTEGKPFDWPVLTCGYQHLITLDTPSGSTAPYIDLSVVPKAA